MFNTQISVLEPPQFSYKLPGMRWVYVAKEPHTTTLGAIAEYIRTQAIQETELLRSIPANENVVVTRKQKIGDKWHDFDKTMPRRKFIKQTQFKMAYFFGVFEHGHKATDMSTPAQLFVLDFDGHDNPDVDMEQARNSLMHDTQVQPLLLFVSPSGDGLKMVVQIPFNNDIEQWRRDLRAVWHYLKQTYGLNADTANIDISRGCYLPHDANVYCNPDARTTLDFEQWQPPQEQEQAQRKKRLYTFDNTPLAGDAERAAWYAEQLELHHCDITGTQPEWARLGYAIGELGEQGRGIFHAMSRAGFANYDWNETEQLYDYCTATRRGSVTLATFMDAAISAIGTTYEKEHKTTMENNNMMSAKMPKTAKSNPEPRANGGEIEQPQEQAQEHAKRYKLKDAPDNELLDVLMHTPTLDEITTMCGETPPGIPTQYTFGIAPELEQLTLPRQALTIIAAQTSGGKTRMLQNIALHVAKYTDESTTGTTLFFSLEEPAPDVILEMANIHSNTELQCGGSIGKNIDILKNATRYAYLRHKCEADDNTPWLQFADASMWEKEPERTQKELDAAQQVVAQFEADFLRAQAATGEPRLRIYGNEDFCNVALIERALRLYSEQGGKIKAVFIDYLGMFRAPENENRLPKTERIERMLDTLEWVAKDLHVPVVISAQLKRENNATPFSLRNSSVADSADIERSCNTMILLWNSREHFDAQGNEATALSNAGFISDVGGKLFARLTKRRGGVRGGAVVLTFAENTGKITMGTGVDMHGNTTPAPMSDAALAQGNNAMGTQEQQQQGTQCPF